VRPHEAGVASGLIDTSQQVGGALGIAILSTIATSRTASILADAGGAESAIRVGVRVRVGGVLPDAGDIDVNVAARSAPAG
jgi:hypothetical protein